MDLTLISSSGTIMQTITKEQTLKPEEIKEARVSKKMTQIDVARAVGVSLAGYRLWESGAGKPIASNLEKLKKVLNVK